MLLLLLWLFLLWVCMCVCVCGGGEHVCVCMCVCMCVFRFGGLGGRWLCVYLCGCVCLSISGQKFRISSFSCVFQAAIEREKAKKDKAAGKDPRAKSPAKKGGKKTPEPQAAKEGSKLKKRGEEDDENKFIGMEIYTDSSFVMPSQPWWLCIRGNFNDIVIIVWCYNNGRKTYFNQSNVHFACLTFIIIITSVTFRSADKFF